MEAAVTTSPAPKTARNASDNQRVPDKKSVKATPATTVSRRDYPAEPAHRTARSKRKGACDCASPTRR